MNNGSIKLRYLIFALTIVVTAASLAFSQKKSEPPKTAPPAKPFVFRPFPVPMVAHGPGGTSEKSIAVDPKVRITLPCVSQGSVKITGWGRSEVRVFIKDGSSIGIRVRQKSPKNDKPVWIAVSNFNDEKSVPVTPSECIWGDEIEIDAPMGAEVVMKGRETKTVVDSIRKASVVSAGGDISFRNIDEGITAVTYQGDITVENSWGGMSLETTSGNIVAFGAGPSDVGDVFKAKTNSGAIALQKLEHRQIEINSISGTIKFDGSLLDSGLYSFGTMNGSISLAVPPDPPCFLSATYGYGNFNSELPIKVSTENISEGPIKTEKGTLGKGDCKVNLTTTSGYIHIKKQ
jgi:Uncharacterized conserved protein